MISALLSADADAVSAPNTAARGHNATVTPSARWNTRVGTIDAHIPKLRTGTHVPEWLLERRKRAKSALITVVADCYLAGVSTRRMDKLVKTLGISVVRVAGLTHGRRPKPDRR